MDRNPNADDPAPVDHRNHYPIHPTFSSQKTSRASPFSPPEHRPMRSTPKCYPATGSLRTSGVDTHQRAGT